jgi:hypothetical protein
MDLNFFLIMIAPFLVVGSSLFFLFAWFSRGNDASLEEHSDKKLATGQTK